MASDAGGKAPRALGRPRASKAGRGHGADGHRPAHGGKGRIYLFRAGPKLKPLKTDYVDYEFRLLSGDYKSTYRRADGPNPEASTVATADYRAGFATAGSSTPSRSTPAPRAARTSSTGCKSGFAPGNCGRSEATYNDAEGAFIANVDGPVRAIRSYLGANSGPLTQRTDVFYAGRHEARIDLRVHAIGSIFSYVDLSPAAFGMTYRSSTAPGGVAVDGVNDAVGTSPALWHLWSGSQGSLFSSNRLTTSIDAAIAAGTTTGFYRDELNTGIHAVLGRRRPDRCGGHPHHARGRPPQHRPTQPARSDLPRRDRQPAVRPRRRHGRGRRLVPAARDAAGDGGEAVQGEEEPPPLRPKSPKGSSRSRTASLNPFSAARRTKSWPSVVWRAMPSKTVPSTCVACRPCEYSGLVDEQLVHHELVDRHLRDPLQQRLENIIQILEGRSFGREPPIDRGRAVDRVAGQQQPLGAGGADAVGPERRRRHAPDPGRRVADLALVLGHDQVRAQRHVGAAGDAVAVHLADHRLVGVEQAHEAAHVAAHHLEVGDRVPGAVGVVVARLDHRIQWRALRRSGVGDPLHLPLRGGHQVIAAAEAGAVPGQRDHVHLGVEVGALDAGRQLSRHLQGDPVAALGTVQGDPGDPAVGLVGEGRELLHQPPVSR